MAVVAALAGGTVAATEAVVAPDPAAAQFATGGSGQYRGLIDWITWGTQGQAVTAGATGGTTRTIGGVDLATTCEVTSIGGGAGGVIVHEPGSFVGDALDDLYNVGGTGTANTMGVGLANAGANETVTIGVSCETTLDGAPVPIEGLVFAEAEASTSTQGEYVQATPDGPVTWRVIERYREPGCTTSTDAVLSASGTLRLQPDGPACTQLPGQAGAAGPIAIGFMEGATAATLEAHGGGRSAVALGVVLGADFGDAPAGYGAAGAIVAPSWTGGEVPVGTTDLFDGFALATPTPPAVPRLGSSVDAEGDAQPSVDATADGADEDGVVGLAAADVEAGEPHSIDVVCVGAGSVAAWIDWDRNGTFDEDERSDVVDCVDETASLSWTVPADAVSALGDERTFLRVRIGPDAASVTSPVGVTVSGEVEDYAITVDVAGAPVDCPANAPGLLYQSDPTTVFSIDLVTGAYAPGTTFGRQFNALGYNVVDGSIYGYVVGSATPNVPWQIVRISGDGTVTNMGRPSGVANATTFNIGDVDENGHYWLTASGAAGVGVPWYQIDLATMTVLDSGTQSAPLGASGADWAYVPGGGDRLYRVMTVGADGVLIAFDRSSHTYTNLGTLPGIAGASGGTGFGAVYADADGYLYASNNGSGNIYRIDVHDVEATLFANGPASAQNDGARCATSPIHIDFGDAAENYGTLLVDDGPRHVVDDLDVPTGTSSLMLGSTIDVEDDGQPSADAAGDDEAGVDDEDGVAGPIQAAAAAPLTVSVTVTNDTGAPATLAGWVDVNGAGGFESSERAVLSVPPGTGTYELAFPIVSTTTDTTARFRVFPGDVANPSPFGSASGGEVEDHPVTVLPAPLPQLCTPEENRAIERYWFFGQNGAIDFGVSGTTASPFLGTQATQEGSTVVTDASGQLQFWSNGQTVFDRNSTPMPNGAGLLGNPSATQTVAAFPSLGNPGIYFVVTTSADVGTAPNGNLSYSIVDMSLNGGLGDVTAKNVPLGAAGTASEAITAVPNADGDGFWVLTFTNGSPNLLAYEFDADGPVSGTAVVSTLPTNNSTWYGSLAFNRDYTSLVQLTGSNAGAATVRLLQFNADSGTVFERLRWGLPTGAGTGNSGYNAEFSPSGDYVYVTKIFGNGRLYRYLVDGAATGAEVKATEQNVGGIGVSGGQVRRGPDGRMYVANHLVGALSVVSAPDAASPGFVANGFPLPAGAVSRFGLPQTVTGCPPPQEFDFGDASEGYGTLLADDGPRHIVTDLDDASGTASLMLGSTIDPEDDGAPSAAADGDDLAGIDDEDGVAAPITGAAGQPITVDVTATNDTGEPATLAGWIDLDGDGAFEAAERVVVPVPPGTATYPLAFPVVATNSDTTARFRLYAGTVADPSPVGLGGPGEVEDHPVEIEPAPPIFLGCSALVTFDSDNEGWRAATTTGGTQVVLPPAPVGWTATGGNPGGAIVSDDLDSNWSELWTPPLAASGYATDYSFAIGTDLQFDYRNTTGVGYDIYVTVAGANGSSYYFVFRDQIVDSTQWTRVVVPLDAAQWVTGFSNTTGPTGAAPTAAAFEAALANVDHFAFSIEGRSGQDTTYFDNFGQPCADFGDAPASYGTTVADGGPEHRVPDFDATDDSAPIMLGSSIDIEDDGQPTTDADGDGADEDGVVFNPSLGYSTPTLLTGLDPDSLAPIENTLEVTASADGFVSVWVDWNQDGDFLDAGEQVASAQAVTAGVNDVEFAQGVNPAAIATYVRVRYSTDAAAIATPGGPAPDGEVEDYRVLVERLVQPDACVADDTRYVALTFAAPVDLEGSGGVGSSARYERVTVVDGVPVDLLAETVAGAMQTASAPPNGYRVGDGGVIGVDDAQWQVNGDATIRYTFVVSGTQTPVPVSAVVTVSDMDGSEIATFSGADLDAYAVTEGSAVTISDAGGSVSFAGSGSWNGDQQSRFQFVVDGLSTLDVRWQGGSNSGFGFDGDGDLSIQPPACSDFGDAPDSYGTTLGADGARHLLTPGLRLGTEIDFDPDGQPSAAADGDDANRTADEDGVATPIVVTVGTAATAEVTVTNSTTESATLAAWVDVDNDGVFEPGERTLLAVPASSGTATYSVPLVDGVTPFSTYARFRLYSGDVADPQPTGAVAGGEVEDYLITIVEPELEITKTSDATVDSRPGDTVTYTVTARNEGNGDYTAANPAVVVDDLSGVLDDATFGDATADRGPDPFFSAPLLTWAGALPAGEEVVIEYTVTLRGGGDGEIRNVAWQPEDPEDPVTPSCDPPVGGVDPVTGEPCATTESELPKLTIAKAVSSTELPADGESLTYTITVTNVGPGDFTAAAPASVTDDLSAVLDDATFSGTATATIDGVPATAPTFSAPELAWSGALGAGEVLVITYSVEYDAELGGDNTLRNLACVPEEDAAQGALPCDIREVPAADLSDWKQVVPSATPTVAGSTLAYTLFFRNDGTADATVDRVDDLTHVLDDAQLTTAPVATGGLAVTQVGDRLEISGTVAPGATETVTYVVTVRPDAERGDDTAANFLLDPGDPPPATPDCVPADGEFPDCTTNAFPAVAYAKSVTASTDPIGPGTVLEYRIEIVNSGAAVGDVARVDDLRDVLDDTELTTPPSSDTPSVTVSGVVDDLFSIGGTLAAGATAVVTYSVTVAEQADRGDNRATNHLLSSPTDPPPTDCLPGECTDTELPFIVPSKSVDPASGTAVEAGDTLTYTLTFENTGGAAGEVAYTDLLAGILDDATVAAPTAPDGFVSGAIVDDTIVVTGTLPGGTTARIQYVVTVLADADRDGDDILGNVLFPTGGTPDCAPGLCTENRVGELVTRKTVTPSSTPVEAGTVLTYTLFFENTGQGAVGVDKIDDLTHVLDDADVTLEPSSAILSAVRTDEVIAITGTVAAGVTAVVTYQVTVRADADRGDDTAANFVLDPGETPPADPDCVPADDEAPDCTVTGIGRLEIEKSVTASTDAVAAGTVLTYELRFENTGEAAVTVDKVDDLSGVLDDAVFTSGPTADDDALSASGPTGGVLAITGELAADQVVVVTYSVTVRPDGERGDNVSRNFVLDPGDPPPTECDPTVVPCTETELPDISVAKSVAASDDPVVAGTVLTYTVTFANQGTAAGDVERIDDLSGVLDDADVTTAPASSDPAQITASPIADGRFTMAGTLAPDAVVTVTYAVTVRDDTERGDSRADNFVLYPGETPPADCDPDVVPCTETSMPELHDRKDVAPVTGTTVVAGDELTYTITFRNDGTAAGTVDRVDDLTHVLDDADLVAGPTASAAALTATGPDAADRIAITGTLDAGAAVTVEYTVRVRAAEDRGDDVIANVLLDPGDPPPTDAECVPEPGQEPDCTTNPVGELRFVKSVDPASFTTVRVGSVLTYTLTFENVGEGAAAVDHRDHLAGVLDDAVMTTQPVADAGLTVVRPEPGDLLVITGSVPAGESRTVQYSVTVLPYDAQGDHRLNNYLTPEEFEPPTLCAPDDPTCTENGIDPPPPGTAVTGTTTALLGAAGALGILALGLGLLAVARRPRRSPEA